MTRVAVVGANGQVGTELVLRLQEIAGLDVVPIVRSRAGSAFLRFAGVECRIGDVSVVAQARELLGDCGVVLNLAHADSYLASGRALNTEVQKAISAGSPRETRLIFSSTIMVYAPELRFRIPNTYGAEKLILERASRRWAHSDGKDLVVLRLGHVLGDLQAISRRINAEILAGPVPLVDRGAGPSNTVFASELADALVRVAKGRERSGTFDLISIPRWTWAEVYEYHAAQLGVPLKIVDGARASSIYRRLLHSASTAATSVVLEQRVRERAAFVMRWLPDTTNDRIETAYQVRRAASDIAALKHDAVSVVEPWRAVGTQPFLGSGPQEAQRTYPLRVPDEGAVNPTWSTSLS